MIDAQRLIACGVGVTQAKTFAPFLADACLRFKIYTVMQQAGLIAQAMHESGGFAHLEENLFYTTHERIRAIFPSTVPSLGEAARLTRNPQALANVVYATKNGNGMPGDGWKFRGRGLFQLTGKNNYRLAGDSLGRDYVTQPDLVAQPEDAALTAAWFWAAAGCNTLMASGEFDQTTRRINGPALAGASARRALYGTCMEALR